MCDELLGSIAKCEDQSIPLVPVTREEVPWMFPKLASLSVCCRLGRLLTQTTIEACCDSAALSLEVDGNSRQSL
jgi:hypothetical protein